MNSKKNSAAYLKKWLDSYFDDERSVAVNTFLRNITITDQSDTEALEKVLENCDLCFNYHKSLKKGECVTCGNMVRNGKWAKYEPKIVKVTSFQERLNQD